MISRLVLILLLCLPTPAFTATIVNDTFTDSDGTNLQGHTPDTGTAWTEVYNSGTHQIGILSNTAQAENSSSTMGAIYTVSGTYPSANYTVTATFTDIGTGVSTTAWALGCRVVVSGTIDGYFAFIVDPGNSNDVVIYRADDSVATKISGSEDTAPADNDVFELECNGSAIGLKKNGSYVITPITDSTYSAAGEAAMGSGEILGLTAYGAFAGHFDVTLLTVSSIDSTSFGPLRRRL